VKPFGMPAARALKSRWWALFPESEREIRDRGLALSESTGATWWLLLVERAGAEEAAALWALWHGGSPLRSEFDLRFLRGAGLRLDEGAPPR
jgi:hypothetical protein